MTTLDFNIKYKDYLGHENYGLVIDNKEVINYLDEQFQELITIPGFEYSQIKVKFNDIRFYCNGLTEERVYNIESKIKELI